MPRDTLRKLVDWFNAQEVHLKRKGVRLNIRRPTQETDNNALYIDADSSDYMGRMTCWESGACDWEILRVKTGETIYYQRRDIDSLQDLYDIAEEFCRDMMQP